MKALVRLAVAATVLVGSAQLSHAGIINGSFEDLGGQGFSNGNWGLFTSVPGWTSTGPQIEIGLGTVYGVTGYDGNNVLELDSTGNAIVSQIVAVPGGTYDLSFQFARRNNVVGASTTFDVYWNGGLLGSYAPTLTAMTLSNLSVVALGSNTLEFRGTGTNDSYGALIDNVQLTSVPDGGATLALLGLAITGMGLLRRKVA